MYFFRYHNFLKALCECSFQSIFFFYLKVTFHIHLIRGILKNKKSLMLTQTHKHIVICFTLALHATLIGTALHFSIALAVGSISLGWDYRRLSGVSELWELQTDRNIECLWLVNRAFCEANLWKSRPMLYMYGLQNYFWLCTLCCSLSAILTWAWCVTHTFDLMYWSTLEILITFGPVF